MKNHDHWHPTWFKPEHAVHWDNVKEAVRRDWQQTKHDFHVGGHEMNQKGGDTLRQAAGTEAIPDNDRENPPKVIGELTGEWELVSLPVEYGYAARRQFGATHVEWNDVLAKNLQLEWEAGPRPSNTAGLWPDVQPHVRHGYEYKS
jgi:hypothetical protein